MAEVPTTLIDESAYEPIFENQEKLRREEEKEGEGAQGDKSEDSKESTLFPLEVRSAASVAFE